jgi:hypothetical protein
LEEELQEKRDDDVDDADGDRSKNAHEERGEARATEESSAAPREGKPALSTRVIGLDDGCFETLV